MSWCCGLWACSVRLHGGHRWRYCWIYQWCHPTLGQQHNLGDVLMTMTERFGLNGRVPFFPKCTCVCYTACARVLLSTPKIATLSLPHELARQVKRSAPTRHACIMQAAQARPTRSRERSDFRRPAAQLGQRLGCSAQGRKGHRFGCTEAASRGESQASQSRHLTAKHAI